MNRATITVTLTATPLERGWVAFMARGLAGLMFVFAGANKVATIGPLTYATQIAARSEMTFYVPEWLIVAAVVPLGFIELLFGAMLMLGLRPRIAARVLGLLMVVTAAVYGLSGLVNPVGGVTAMNVTVVNTYILPRAALLILFLMLPEEDDVLKIAR